MNDHPTPAGRSRAAVSRADAVRVDAVPPSADPQPIYWINAMLVGGSLTPIVAMIAVALPWLTGIPDPVELLELLVILVSCSAGITMSFIDGCRPLLLIFSTFYLCWLGIGPLYQLSHGEMPWGDDARTHDVGAVRGALFITDVFLVIFFFAAARGAQSTKKRRVRRPTGQLSTGHVPTGWPSLLLSVVLLPYVVVSSGGVSQLFASRDAHDAALAANGLTLQQSGGATLALAGTLPGAAAVAAALLFVCRLHYAREDRRRSDVVGLVLSVATTVLYCNPLSNTRFIAVSAFGALVIAWLRPTRRSAGAVLAVLALLGTAFVYPLLSIFKSSSGTQSASFASGFKAFASADFDGFQQITNAMDYVRTHGFGMGHYVFSALLYFVPRSIWQGKAQPASIDVAANRDYVFTNLSLPVHAEFYLDFGAFGLIGLAVGLGLLWGRLDEHWVRRQTTPLQFTLVCYFSCAQLGFIRGPLGSVGPVYYTTILLILGSFAWEWVKSRVRALVRLQVTAPQERPCPA